MSKREKQSTLPDQNPLEASASEPVAASRTLPAILIGLLGAMLYWGDMYVMDNGGDLMGKGGSFPDQVYYPHGSFAQIEALNPKVDKGLFEEGRIAYGKYCVACHQGNGMGMPGQFPPLAGSEWVTAEGPNRIIRIILDGLQGPITVKGQEYNGVMVPWRDVITDPKEIAAVATFIRQEWGNTGSEVSPEKVEEIKEATKSRAGRAWTAADLQSVPVAD